MSLQEDIKPYLKSGFVETSKDGDSGNKIRESSQYYRLIKQQNTSWLSLLEIKKGLYRKGPNNLTGITSVDDLAPLCTYFFSIGRFDMSKDVLDYIKSHGGFYVTGQLPWYKVWKFFIARNLSLMAHLYYCSNERPPMFLQYWHRKAIRECGVQHPEHQDEWILSNELIIASRDKDPVVNQLQKDFFKRLTDWWPNGFKDVLDKYYNLPNGESHPLAIYYQ